MFQGFLRKPAIGLAMMLALSASALPAHAGGDGCLPPARAPRGLSDFLGQIRALTGGGAVVHACLKQVGNRYVYEVKVQIGGRVVTLNIDAATGAPQ
jgi:hypothetical protein